MSVVSRSDCGFDEKGLGQDEKKTCVRATPCLIQISCHTNLFAPRVPNLRLVHVSRKKTDDEKSIYNAIFQFVIRHTSGAIYGYVPYIPVVVWVL